MSFSHSSWFWFTALVSTRASFFKQPMKFVYTILFFTDTLALVLLSYLLFKLLDQGGSRSSILLLAAALIVSILLLIYFFNRYLKLPPHKSGS